MADKITIRELIVKLAFEVEDQKIKMFDSALERLKGAATGVGQSLTGMAAGASQALAVAKTKLQGVTAGLVDALQSAAGATGGLQLTFESFRSVGDHFSQFLLGTESGLTKASSALEIFQFVASITVESVRLLGAALSSVTLEIADQADALDEAAQQVGLTASTYDALSASVQLNGASVGQLNSGLAKLTAGVQEFVATGKGGDAFAALLGGDARQRLSEIKSIDEALGMVADGLAKVEDPVRQLALAQDVLGKSGGKLLPTLKGGSDGLRQQLEAMQRVGMFTPQLIEQGSKLGDQLAGLALRSRGIRLAIGEATVPAFAALVEQLNLTIDAARKVFDPQIRAAAQALANVIRGLGEWLSSLRKQALESERGMATLKTTMIFMGVVVGLLVAQALPSLVLWLGRTALAAARAGLAMATAWVKAAAPLLIIAGMITGLILLIDDLITYVEGGESAFGQLLASMTATSPVLAALAEGLRMLFGGGLGEALFDAFAALRTSALEIIASIESAVMAIPDAVMGALRALGDAVPDVLKSLGSAAGAVPGAFVSPGQALAGSSGGSTNNVTVGGSSVNVSVSGAGDPRAVGVEVARQTEDALGRQTARAIRDMRPAMRY